jgi:hypothetical protein
LRGALGQDVSHRGAPVPYKIAEEGLRVRTWDKRAAGETPILSGEPASIAAKS